MTVWITCRERMPDEGVPVLVATDGRMLVASWMRFMGKAGGFATCVHRDCKRIWTHLPYVSYWMPLPDLPQ